MGDYWTNPVRHPEDIGVGHIRRTVLVADANNTGTYPNGVPIGALEAGAVPMRVDVYVSTVYNGTTPAIDLGIIGTPAGFAPAASTLVGALGFKPGITAGTLMGKPLDADAVVYAKPTLVGATTGAAMFVMSFVNRREIEGIPFPNNP